MESEVLGGGLCWWCEKVIPKDVKGFYAIEPIWPTDKIRSVAVICRECVKKRAEESGRRGQDPSSRFDR